MTEDELLEQIVGELEADRELQIKEREEFKERYEDLAACAIDELNDEVLKKKLRDVKFTGRITILRPGRYPVWRSGILSGTQIIGGEEFALHGFELGDTKNPKSMINVLFKPLTDDNYDYLSLSYSDALDVLSDEFKVTIIKHIYPAMQDIEKDVLKLQHEFAERNRNRQIKRLESEQGETVYSELGAWG